MRVTQPKTHRRFMRIGVDAESLAHMITTGWNSHDGEKYGIRIVEGMPADACLVGISTDVNYFPLRVWYIFEHESFDVVDPNREVPTFLGLAREVYERPSRGTRESR